MTLAQAQPTARQLGDYQLLAKIGEGGISTIHVARIDGPAGFSKLAVIKELRAELIGSREARAMFLNEMRLAARLSHPNVVHAYAANEDQGQLYLAMEYLDGQPWSRARRVLLQRGQLPGTLHLKVIAEVLAGLHYAHELRDYDGSPMHVVHCDVSQENVIVTHEGLVKVVDFGVARAVLPSATAPALVGGKLSYIAPEQLRGDAIDRRADIFAVGVMLWEALARQRFAPSKESETRRRRELGLERRLSVVAPSTPAALREICEHALALDPKERFATAAELRDALLRAIGDEMQDRDRVRLGGLIRDAFHEERARVHGILEHSFKAPAQTTSSIERWTAAPSFEQTQPSDPATQSAQPLRTLLLLGAAVALLSFLVTFIVSRPEPHVVTPAARPAPSHTVAPAPVAAPARKIQLSIAASPASAVLYLDGVALPENPYTAQLVSDPQVHTVHAMLNHVVSPPRLISFDHDRAVSFDLEVAPEPRPAARAPQPRAATSAAKPATGNPSPVRVLSDLYDQPLRKQATVRPIDEQSPY